MKIVALKARSLELPYRKPLVTAANRFSKAGGLLVEAVSEEGLTGFGYADLFPRTGETLGSATYAIEKIIKPAVEGRDIDEIGKIEREINRLLTGNPRAKSAVQSALYDLLARHLEVPLCLLLGGAVKEGVRVVRFVGLAEPEVMAQDARELAQRGFDALKLKISGDPELDILRVAKVREAVGDGVFIKVDANESYDVKSAIRAAKKLADFGIEIFEQPLPRAQIEALREVKRSSPIKIEADQSAVSVSDAYRLVKDGVVDSINTSVQKAGGLRQAKEIAELCGVAGIDCTFGNTAGSMVGDAAALHLAASCAAVSQLCELGEFESVADDPFSGLEIDAGFLRVPSGEGLGITSLKS